MILPICIINCNFFNEYLILLLFDIFVLFQKLLDTLIFITGRNNLAVEDQFDGNNELELALRTKGKNEMADMVKNILPAGIECVFVRQREQLGLGHAVLCA